MKRGGVLFDPKARKDVSTTWEVQLRSLPVSVTKLTSGKYTGNLASYNNKCQLATICCLCSLFFA